PATAAASGRGCPPERRTIPADAASARIRKLPPTSRAGRRAVGMPRTVHHRAAKYRSPSSRPPAAASRIRTVDTSPMLVLLPFPVVALIRPLLEGHPVPRVPAADEEPGRHEHQGPGEPAGPARVDPEAGRDAEQRRDGDRPPDHAVHAQPEPGPPVAVTPGLSSALRPVGDAPRERIVRPLRVRRRHGSPGPSAGE